MPPLQIGPYRIVGTLGEGGTGAVYEALQEPIGRRVAIKILLPQHARNHEALQRFFNEARAVNMIEHPSIVQVSDYNQAPDGTAYLVMEYLRGEVLSTRLERIHSEGGRLPLEDVLQVGVQIAGALTAAHEKAVIHRDLKPSNVMLVHDSAFPRSERVKILDFGLAKLVQGQAQETAPNALLGTPQYMSPEQCRGAGGVNEKTDVYALGLILFEMLAGQPPFVAETPIEYIGQHAFRPAPALQSLAPTVSDKLAALVNKLLVKEKEQRPPMREVEAELTRQLTQLLSAKRSASSPVPDKDADATHRYLPPPPPPPPPPRSAEPPPTTISKTVEARRPPLAPKRVPAAAVPIAAGLLVLILIAWVGHELRSLRPTRQATRTEPAEPTLDRQGPLPDLGAPPAPSALPQPQAPEPTLPPGAAPVSARPVPNVSETLQRAQAAFDGGEYPKVIKLAYPIALRSPRRAWRLIGSAACNLQDLKQANEAFRHLDADGKKYLAIVCAKNGFQVFDSHFKLVPTPPKPR